MLLSKVLPCILAMVCTLSASETHALRIRQTEWNSHQVLLATGEIEQGDAERMARVLVDIQPLPHGLPVILLDSGGGSVAEALKISELFERRPVHTVVAAGGRCTSACASIIFVSGTNRTCPLRVVRWQC